MIIGGSMDIYKTKQVAMKVLDLLNKFEKLIPGDRVWIDNIKNYIFEGEFREAQDILGGYPPRVMLDELVEKGVITAEELPPIEADELISEAYDTIDEIGKRLNQGDPLDSEMQKILDTLLESRK